MGDQALWGRDDRFFLMLTRMPVHGCLKAERPTGSSLRGSRLGEGEQLRGEMSVNQLGLHGSRMRSERNPFDADLSRPGTA